MKRTFRFYKTASRQWYIDLPEWQGEQAALEMVAGADTMLDTVSQGSNECLLTLSDSPFEGSDQLMLIEDLTGSIGGGHYLMASYRGAPIHHTMWLCEVTVFVFEGLPKFIYLGYPSLP